MVLKVRSILEGIVQNLVLAKGMRLESSNLMQRSLLIFGIKICGGYKNYYTLNCPTAFSHQNSHPCFNFSDYRIPFFGALNLFVFPKKINPPHVKW